MLLISGDCLARVDSAPSPQLGGSSKLVSEQISHPDSKSGACDPPSISNSLSHDHTLDQLDKIRVYILSLLDNLDFPVDLNFTTMGKCVLDRVVPLSELYAKVFPERCNLRKGCSKPLVWPGIRSRRSQISNAYKYLKKKNYKSSPETRRAGPEWQCLRWRIVQEGRLHSSWLCQILEANLRAVWQLQSSLTDQ